MDGFGNELEVVADRLDHAAASIENAVGQAERVVNDTLWVAGRAADLRDAVARRRATVEQVSSRLRGVARALRDHQDQPGSGATARRGDGCEP